MLHHQVLELCFVNGGTTDSHSTETRSTGQTKGLIVAGETRQRGGDDVIDGGLRQTGTDSDCTSTETHKQGFAAKGETG